MGFEMISTLTGVAAEATTDTVYITQAISNVDFKQILNEIVAVAPTILPVIVSIVAFKKALRWVIGSVKGA